MKNDTRDTDRCSRLVLSSKQVPCPPQYRRPAASRRPGQSRTFRLRDGAPSFCRPSTLRTPFPCSDGDGCSRQAHEFAERGTPETPLLTGQIPFRVMVLSGRIGLPATHMKPRRLSQPSWPGLLQYHEALVRGPKTQKKLVVVALLAGSLLAGSLVGARG
jgi:hypothetical protein